MVTTTMAVGRTVVKLGEGASSATQSLTGERPENLVSRGADLLNPMRPIYSLVDTLKQSAVVAAKPLAALGVGVTAAITVSRLRAFRRAEQNIQFADENLMRLIRTIQGQYLGQLWSGYLKQKLEMLKYIATVFGQNLTQAQITGLEAAGGVEALATEWETTFSAQLQQSGMQEIINTLTPAEARRLEQLINEELRSAKGEVERALRDYQRFLERPLLDQAYAGSHNVLVACSTSALGGIKTLTSGILKAAQVGAAAAIAGGAGVAAVGIGMLQQRANAENQVLREQMQRLLTRRAAEQEAAAAEARRLAAANNARRLAAANNARRVANEAAAEARRVANQAAAAEARRVANEAAAALAIVPRNAPLGLGPALEALPRLEQEQLQQLPNVIELHAEQQGMLALENVPAAAAEGGRRHVKRRSMTKKHKKHTKKTRKH